MLPRDEIENLLVVVASAIDLARDGKVQEGYNCLLAGLHRAEELRDDGRSWGEELVSHFQFAVDHYREKYGVA